MNNNKTTLELGQILKEMYEKAQSGEHTLKIRLFGIKYADEIKNNHSVSEIIKASGLPRSYNTEVYKGIKLAKYVVAKENA